MVSYQYYLHFPKLQKYSYNQKTSINTLEQKKLAVCWAEAEEALRKQDKSLYYLDWSKQDQLFKDVVSPENNITWPIPSNIYMPIKKPETVMPVMFMDMVNDFRFAMEEKDINEIHKSSKLVLDTWNSFKKIKPKAYIIRDDLEELLISSTSYAFSQLIDYLYSCNRAYSGYEGNYRHGYDRSVDKKLAVSAMLLRFWFGQVNFNSIEKYAKVDKLREYEKKGSNYRNDILHGTTNSIHEFLDAFNVYLDKPKVDKLKEEEFKIQKEEALERVKILFNNNYIKSLEELNSEDCIDYEFLKGTDNFVVEQTGMEENVLLDDIIEEIDKLNKLKEFSKKYEETSPEYSEKLTEYNKPEVVGKVRDEKKKYKDYLNRMEESKKQKEQFDRESDAKIVAKGRPIVESSIAEASYENLVLESFEDSIKNSILTKKDPILGEVKKEKADIVIPSMEVIAKKQRNKFNKQNDAKVVSKVRIDKVHNI